MGLDPLMNVVDIKPDFTGGKEDVWKCVSLDERLNPPGADKQNLSYIVLVEKCPYSSHDRQIKGGS